MVPEPEPPEVAPQDWARFCSDFSNENRGRLVSVVVQDADGSSHTLADDIPLLGIDGGAGQGIQLMLGDQPGDNIQHTVIDPSSIVVAWNRNGLRDGIEIHSADGSITTLRLQPPARAGKGRH